MSEGEMILYTTEDGAAKIQLRAVDGTVWLTQAQMADLFDTTVPNINKHIKGILADGEVSGTTIEDYSIVRNEGGREVRRTVSHYNLEMILSVGYRVRSTRGAQFRRWATTALRDYLVKGFVINDERLKDPAQDYFDELLERIRDIRASEARFYKKVRDILALSADYDRNDGAVVEFYARIQNKMLHAVTGHTAAEVIAERANPDRPHMGLTSWKGARAARVMSPPPKIILGKMRSANLTSSSPCSLIPPTCARGVVRPCIWASGRMCWTVSCNPTNCRCCAMPAVCRRRTQKNRPSTLCRF